MKNLKPSENVNVDLLLQCSHGACKFFLLGGSVGVRLGIRRVFKINPKRQKPRKHSQGPKRLLNEAKNVRTKNSIAPNKPIYETDGALNSLGSSNGVKSRVERYSNEVAVLPSSR